MKKMNNFLNNKQGGEKIFSIWWFFIIALVGLGIVMGVWIFYSADVDVRQAEADMLYERIANCIINNGFIDNALGENFNVFEKCHISEELFNQSSAFYFRFNISDENGNALGKRVSAGTNMEVNCDLMIGNPEEEDRQNAEEFPKCAKKQERVLYYDDGEIKKAVVEILAASDNIGEEVSL